MRFILEHPWLSSFMITAISFALVWTGLRDGKLLRSKVGGVVFLVAVGACVLGLVVDTPTEHAKRVVYSFVKAVEEGNTTSVPSMLHRDVILVDQWKGISETGIEGVIASVHKLHQKHTLSYNTILRFQPVERTNDVLVELSLLSRVSGIGTVPSRWRLLIMPNDLGDWTIYSIDAIEIMGRSYR
jgi:hypothetical protein